MEDIMIMWVLSVLLLQIWITAGQECGGAPNVTLNCTDGSARVEWVASEPGCQFYCEAHWSCTNMTHYHSNTSNFNSCVSKWNFNIPWDHYQCNVTVLYRYFSLDTFKNEWAPSTVESCSDPTTVRVTSIGNQTVGDPLSLRCDVTTISYISNVDIIWKINGVEVNRTSNVEKDPMSDVPLTLYTNFYNSTELLQLNDNNTIYQCQAVMQPQFYPLSLEMVTSDNFSLIVKVPDTGLQSMKCSIPTKSNINENVDIIWMTTEGTVVQTVKNVLGDVDGDITTYQHNLLRRKNDSTAYSCQLRVNSNPSLPQLGITDVVPSAVNVTALNYQTALTDESLHLECSINVTYTANSVDFTWEANGQELSRGTINNSDNGIFTHLYNTTSLTQEDDNTEYTCRVVINGNQSLTEFGTYQLTLSENDTTSITPTSTPRPSSTSPTPTTSTSSSDSSQRTSIILAVVVVILIIAVFIGIFVTAVILWKGRKLIRNRSIYIGEPPLSNTYSCMSMSEGGLSACETVTDASSWIGIDSSSVTSEDMLNYILNAKTCTSSSVAADNFSSCLQDDPTVHNRFSLLTRRSSSLPYKYFSVNEMFSISKKDNVTTQGYVDYHTAKQVSDTTSDSSDVSSWNYLPDDFGDELPLTPKHVHVL